MNRQDALGNGKGLLGSAVVGFALAFAPQAGIAQAAFNAPADASRVASSAFGLDGLAAKGTVLASQDPMAAEIRKLLADASARRGFDIGLAVAEGQTLPGPGKQRIHDSLLPGEQESYSIAVAYSLARNRLAAAKAGAAIGNGSNPGGDDAVLAADAVMAHNAVRSAAMPAPDPVLPPMAWNSATARVAQGWADKCQFMHNPQRGSLGENLFATTNKSSMPAVVDQWSNEAAAYDYASGTCSNAGEGNTCSHYTQIVWRDSIGLGCGMKNCATGNPFGGSGSWQFWVCNYSPPGNVVGESPY